MTSFALWLVGVGGRTSGLALAALSLLVIARALGPHGSGQYFLFVSFLLVLATVGDLGVSQSAVVFVGKRDVAMSDIHRTLVVIAIVIAIIVAAIAALAIPYLDDNLLAGIPAEWSFGALALLPLKIYVNYWTAMMLGARRLVAFNAVQLGANALLLAADVAFVATTGSAVWAVVVYGAVLVVQAAAMFVVAARARRYDVGVHAELHRIAPEILRFAMRGYLNSLSTLLWARAVIFLLNAFHGPAAVGIFSVSQQLAEKALVPIQAIQDLTYARMAQLPRDAATAALNRMMRIGLATIVPTLALAVVVSPSVVPLLFSESFRGSTLPLQLLLVGSAVQAVPLLVSTYFLAQLRRPGLLSLLASANAVLNIVVALFLIPGGAEAGAAAAVVVTQLLGTLAVFGLYLRLGRTDAISALLVRREDITVLRQQVRALVGRSG